MTTIFGGASSSSESSSEEEGQEEEVMQKLETGMPHCKHPYSFAVIPTYTHMSNLCSLEIIAYWYLLFCRQPARPHHGRGHQGYEPVL